MRWLDIIVQAGSAFGFIPSLLLISAFPVFLWQWAYRLQPLGASIKAGASLVAAAVGLWLIYLAFGVLQIAVVVALAYILG